MAGGETTKGQKSRHLRRPLGHGQPVSEQRLVEEVTILPVRLLVASMNLSTVRAARDRVADGRERVSNGHHGTSALGRCNQEPDLVSAGTPSSLIREQIVVGEDGTSSSRITFSACAPAPPVGAPRGQ